MTDYECVGGPLDGEHLTLAEHPKVHPIEMNGWGYVLDGETLVWRRLSS
ncbi:hypothetical protein [Pseudarthrobacter sp. NIBRBAC000502770]|nr:hypothetical protein [Pseudarthrobacter sp. NIBRBAC000502770]